MATIKESLVAELDQHDFKDATINKALEDQGLLGTATFVHGSHQKLLDMALISLLKKILSRANVSEGGYSISYREGIREHITSLYTLYEMTDPDAPKVEDASFMW